MFVLVVLALMVTMFIGGWIRADLVAVIGLVVLVLAGQLTVAEATAGFSNSVVLMIAGLFIVGAGLFHTGVAERIGRKIVTLANRSERRLFVLVMVTTALLSSVLSNTGTVALFLPIVLAASRQLRVQASRLLMPLAFFSSLGGTMTLIGTPPNLVAAEALRGSESGGLSFLALFPIGVVTVGCALFYFHVAGGRLFKGEEEVNVIVSEATPDVRVHALDVPNGHPLIGRTLRDLAWSRDGVLVLAEKVKGRKRRLTLAKADTPIVSGSLFVTGVDEDVHDLAEREGLICHLANTEEVISRTSGLVAFTIPLRSPLVGSCLRDEQLRQKYELNILRILRANEEIACTLLQETRLRAGDVLIAQGDWRTLERMEERHELMLAHRTVRDTANEIVSKRYAGWAVGIMAMLLCSLVFEWVDPTLAVWIAAVAMVLSGAVRTMETAYESIQLPSLVLIAAMIPIGTALDNAGLTSQLVAWMNVEIGQYGAEWVVVVLFVATMLLSQIISNTATAILFIPLALSISEALALRPEPFVVAVALAASYAFMTPFASPTNAMVMVAGGYRFIDYVRVGLPLQVLVSIVTLFMVLWMFPF